MKLSHRRISSLERDLQSFRSHTESLKGELSAACTRLNHHNNIPVGAPLVGREGKEQECMVPLVQTTRVRELGAMVGEQLEDKISSVLSWS